jgi:peptidoglycan/xylan/chitin deacetylase (PgdA/CDA1 family)
MKRLLLYFFSIGLILLLVGCQLPNQIIERIKGFQLPPKVIDGSTELSVFEDASKWSPIFGTVSDDPNFSRSGKQALLQSGEGVGVVDAERKINLQFDSAPRMRLSVYVHHTPVKIAVILSSGSQPNAFFIARVGYHATALQKGWNLIDIYPEQWEVNAGEDWANTMTTLRIRVEPEEGDAAPKVSWDQMLVNPPGIPGVMVTFDDGLSSTYTKAFNMMRQFNAPATAYVITDRIGSSSRYLTLDQLIEMDQSGWSIANHSHTHKKPLISYEPDTIELELASARDALVAWGLTRAAAHVAYPWGNWNLDVLDKMRTTGMKTGRMVDDVDHVTWPANGQNYFIGTRLVDYRHTPEDLKGWIDQAIVQERILVLIFHDIVDADAGREQWLYADFVEIIDYIHKKELPFITVNDFHAIATTNTLPIADAYQVREDRDLTVKEPGLMLNDYFLRDVDARVILENPIDTDLGELTVFGDGSFHFSPKAGRVGTANFQYRICVHGDCTEPAEVSIQVGEK